MEIIGYFPEDKAIFGGCLIKEIDASKGYLGDANVNAWSETIEKIRQKYPEVEIVIPGHGSTGGKELLPRPISGRSEAQKIKGPDTIGDRVLSLVQLNLHKEEQ